MNVDASELVVNGTTYVPKGTQNKDIVSPIKICVLQRGWVMIGRFTRDGNNCNLTNAYNIRQWGTTKGLGELAESGATSKTVLDKCNGVVEFDALTMCFSIDCKESSWKQL